MTKKTVWLIEAVQKHEAGILALKDEVESFRPKHSELDDAELDAVIRLGREIVAAHDEAMKAAAENNKKLSEAQIWAAVAECAFMKRNQCGKYAYVARHEETVRAARTEGKLKKVGIEKLNTEVRKLNGEFHQRQGKARDTADPLIVDDKVADLEERLKSEVMEGIAREAKLQADINNLKALLAQAEDTIYSLQSRPLDVPETIEDDVITETPAEKLNRRQLMLKIARQDGYFSLWQEAIARADLLQRELQQLKVEPETVSDADILEAPLGRLNKRQLMLLAEDYKALRETQFARSKREHRGTARKFRKPAANVSNYA